MIRRAQQEDVQAIIPLLALRHQEVAPWSGRFSEGNARAKLMEMTHPGGCGVVGIIEVSRETPEVVASVGLTVARFWDTEDCHLEDLWTFVHPEHRKSSYLKGLIAFAKAVSNTMNLKLIMAQAETEATKSQIDFVLSRHLARAGIIFSHEPVPALERACG